MAGKILSAEETVGTYNAVLYQIKQAITGIAQMTLNLGDAEGMSESAPKRAVIADGAELHKCLVRALDLGGFDDRGSDLHAKIKQHRDGILNVLGSPGDWGHESPLGAALHALCDIDIRPLRQ